MLPTQGSTQVYSPFGSYVVEQHGDDAGCRHAEPEADRPTRADPVAAIRRRLGEVAHRLRVKQSPVQNFEMTGNGRTERRRIPLRKSHENLQGLPRTPPSLLHGLRLITRP